MVIMIKGIYCYLHFSKNITQRLTCSIPSVSLVGNNSPGEERQDLQCGFHLTNRFHVAVHLFSNRSQMKSKCGKNKKTGTQAIRRVSLLLMFLPHFNFICMWSINKQMHSNIILKKQTNKCFMVKILWFCRFNVCSSPSRAFEGHLTGWRSPPRGICSQRAAHGWGIWQFSQYKGLYINGYFLKTKAYKILNTNRTY